MSVIRVTLMVAKIDCLCDAYYFAEEILKIRMKQEIN